MENNVKKEFELYEPMRLWLQKYLEENGYEYSKELNRFVITQQTSN